MSGVKYTVELSESNTATVVFSGIEDDMYSKLIHDALEKTLDTFAHYAEAIYARDLISATDFDANVDKLLANDMKYFLHLEMAMLEMKKVFTTIDEITSS